LAVGDLGVWRSTDGGEHFRSANTGMNCGSFNTLAAGADGILWAGYDGKLFRSRDGGTTWRTSGRGLAPPLGYFGMILDFATAPSDPKTAYAVLATDVDHVRFVVTHDAGEQWSTQTLPPFAGGLYGNTVVAVDPHDSERVYWATLSGVSSGRFIPGLWRSEDSGASWKELGDLHGAWLNDLAIDPNRTENLFALEGGTLVRSTDGGRTFTRVGAGLPVDDFVNGRQLAVDPEHPSHLWVAGDTAAYESNDAGATFQELGALPLSADRAVAVGAGGVLLVATDLGAVVRWNDRAKRFEPLGDGGQPFTIGHAHIVVDPETRTHVYAASAYQSVWRLDLEP
jgi:photosystem II stability/assembly factor-like uncharacterized protein